MLFQSVYCMYMYKHFEHEIWTIKVGIYWFWKLCQNKLKPGTDWLSVRPSPPILPTARSTSAWHQCTRYEGYMMSWARAKPWDYFPNHKIWANLAVEHPDPESIYVFHYWGTTCPKTDRPFGGCREMNSSRSEGTMGSIQDPTGSMNQYQDSM